MHHILSIISFRRLFIWGLWVCAMFPCYLSAQETIPKLILPIGHTDWVSSAQFSNDGKCIITASKDNTAKVWDAVKGKLLQSLEGHTDELFVAQFSHDGKKILTGSRDKTAKVWDAATGELLLNLELTDWVYSAQFSPDGKRILTASRDKSAKLWDAKTGQLLFNLNGHYAEVNSAQFSPDGKWILTASVDKTAKVWNAASGQLLLNLEGHSAEVISAQFSPDGKWILTASIDKTAKMWDATMGELLLNLEVTDYVHSAQFSPDGKSIITVTSPFTAIIWNVASGKMLQSLDYYKLSVYHDFVYDASYSPDGNQIITAGYESAKIWDSSFSEVLLDLNGQTVGIVYPKFSPGGEHVLTIISWDGTPRIWELESGQLLLNLKGHAAGRIWFSHFSPDGKFILTGSEDNTAKVWDALNGKLLLNIEHTDWVFSVHISPDGKSILTASRDKTAKLWDPKTGQLLFNLNGHYAEVNSAQFSHDGKRILTASNDKTAKLWDAKSGKLIHSLDDHKSEVYTAQFSPDGKLILTASADKTAKLWDAASGKQIKNLEEHTDELTLAKFSHDGKRILTASYDKTAKVYDTATGVLIHNLKGHTDIVWTAQFSHDGNRILTGSWDNTAKLWDAKSGKLLHSLDDHKSRVYTAQFSHDEKYILTASNDHKTILWDTQTGKMLYTRIQLKDDDWLVYDEHYRYDGSAGAREKLYFVCGLEVIELNQLKDALYVPGLASKIMKGEDINFPKLYDLEICDVFPEIREMPAEDHFFHYKILPRKKKIESIEIWLNDKRIRSIPADSLPSGPEGIQLILPKSDIEPLYIPGEENKLKINALVNLMGTEARSRGMIVSGLKNKEKKASPRLFALMIGVDTYKDQSLQLRFPAKDASDLGKVLQLSAEKFLGADRVHMYYIHSMVGQSGGYTTPEKEGIRRALEEIGRKARPEDVVLIFFAGHGVLRPADGLFTLLTAEASSLLPTGISTAELMEWISPEGPYALKASKSILIFDACHSGKGAEELIAWSRRSDEETRRRRQIDDLSDKAGMYILAASASNQSAYEVRHYEQGLLTYSLLHTLQNNPGILDDQQFLNVQKWFLDSERHLQQLVRELGLEQQAQPYGSANIRIGMVDEEVRSAIRLAEVRPLMYCALAINRDTDVDDLDLKSALNYALKAVSDRGSNAPFMFSEQGSSTAYTINISYEWSERQLSARITLLKGKEVLFRTNVEGSTENIPELIEAIIASMMDFVK
jgi:WD40 repeat protein